MPKATRTALLLLLAGCDLTPAVVTARPKYDECYGFKDASWQLQSKIWDDIYARYFGPATPGHCGNVGCHGDQARGRFLAGMTRDSMFAGLLAGKIISPEDPPDSRLIHGTLTPLVWISPRGGMPLDNRVPNEAARTDITIWLTGTRCGLLPAAEDGGAGPDAKQSSPD